MSKILVVDDEASIRRLVRSYLEKEAHEVLEAENGEQAVEMTRSASPELIVLDVGMPVLDGVEALRTIRTFSNVYVVMLTARSDEVDKLIGLSIGADDYLTKPFSPRELVARIKAVLRRSRATGAENNDRLEFPGLTIDLGRRRRRGRRADHPRVRSSRCIGGTAGPCLLEEAADRVDLGLGLFWRRAGGRRTRTKTPQGIG